ncbi:CLOCK-interacting pacemaker isoform X2 [Dunckerocampus dactyliophorus]|uniref:CLOCK-interacting pacemaker isoform X2 n=1 Tax=Dunckerocampus dactyliophorus TaxID=161453 RepID=UPI0024052AEA|nr:CLOCK-interacting pacemaker isoform X2 [Dunckerocampus dactyliophorus]
MAQTGSRRMRRISRAVKVNPEGGLRCRRPVKAKMLGKEKLGKAETIQTNGQLLWRNGLSEAAGSGGPPMGLFQQPSLMPTAFQLLKPSSRKSNHTTGKKVTTTTYLPILNSYPRIAPHPSKKPPDKSLLTDEAHNLRKRVCTECKEHLKPATRSQEPATLEQPCPSSASSCGTPPCSVSSSPSAPTSEVPQISGAGSTSHHRFLNTVEALHQSGLLDITLRTKELLHQSNATEREIAQLRQHTELLCQAAGRSLSGAVATWQSVHRTMTESRYYPGLKKLQHLQSQSYAVPESVAEDGVNMVMIPRQNCDVSQQSHTEPRRELVAFIPPDSSTG